MFYNHKTLLWIPVWSVVGEKDPKVTRVVETAALAERRVRTQTEDEEFRVQVPTEPQPVPNLPSRQQVPHRKPTQRRSHEQGNLLLEWQTQPEWLKEGSLLFWEIPHETTELAEEQWCRRVPKTDHWDGKEESWRKREEEKKNGKHRIRWIDEKIEEIVSKVGSFIKQII